MVKGDKPPVGTYNAQVQYRVLGESFQSGTLAVHYQYVEASKSVSPWAFLPGKSKNHAS
jgi:hypothetical protein